MADKFGPHKQVAFTDNSEIVLLEFSYKEFNKRGIVFFLSCDQDGTIQITYRDPFGQEHDFKSKDITGGILACLDTDHPLGRGQLKFTPSDNPGTVTVEAIHY